MLRQAMTSLTILFFMMGFITCLNDILVPYLKAVFALDYTRAALVQFCFFAAYGLTALPFSRLIERVGYQRGMVMGFALAAVGCLLFYPAVVWHTYVLFLAALFVLAAGIVLLQVAANPCVASIGPAETASSRLTMAQAFNSLGTFIAPLFGAYFILSRMSQSPHASGLVLPYLCIAAVLALIAWGLSRLPLQGLATQAAVTHPWRSLLADRRLRFGMLGIFCYVGAEVAIGSFLVNFIKDLTQQTEAAAAPMVALYWGGAMVGRFIGIATLRACAPARVLLTHALLAMALLCVAMQASGQWAVYAVVLVGLMNSIMFPTIFTLSLRDLSAGQEKKASGLLATAIVGGAVIPLCTGMLADQVGLQLAFALPVLCYGYIAWFGRRALRH